MSRVNSHEIENQGTLNLLEANLDRTIKGKKGQEFLKKLLSALDAMQVKELHTDALKNEEGGFCALGCYANHFKVKTDDIYPDDALAISKRFGISQMLVWQIIWENDENLVNDKMWIYSLLVGPVRTRSTEWGEHRQRQLVPDPDAPRKRWEAMRQWVVDNIVDNGCKNA